MTTKCLEIASQMLIYMDIEMESSTKMLMKFYWDLFQIQPPDKIILTLNRFLHLDKNWHSKIVQKLFKKVSSLLTLKHEEIQSLMAGGDAENVSDKNMKTILMKGKK